MNHEQYISLETMQATILCSLFLCLKCVQSGNILYLSSLPSPSHHLWNRALALGLAEKGHNITSIGLDRDDKVLNNYTHIWMEGVYEAINLDLTEMGELNCLELLQDMNVIFYKMCEAMLKSQGLKQLLNYPKKFQFDAIIIDVTSSYCLYPLIAKFGYPPTVAVTAFLLPSYVSFSFGNHFFPAYTPWYGFPYNKELTIGQRVINTVLPYMEIFTRYYVLGKREYKLVTTVFGENTPSFESLERHVSIVLANTDPILDRPQVLAPNFIPVGGLQIKTTKLPQDLQNIADGAKNGLIVFSLGTNVRSEALPKQSIEAFLEAFSQISETVIWKFQGKVENLPKNVIIRKWLPQSDLLGHKNVKLFIGHGGALSTQEAIYHGVPLICIPFFLDQAMNTRHIVDRKFGVYLNHKEITTDTVLKTLQEIINNSIYRDNVKKASALFKDKKETPLEVAVRWIEFTMRHGGAQFLSTPARDLPFYVSEGFDVLFFLFLIIFVAAALFYRVLKVSLKLCLKRKKVKIN